MNFKYTVSILIFSLCICSDQIPGKIQSNAIVLKNGTIHTVSDSTFKGDLKFKDGKIVEIDTDIRTLNTDRVIDISNLHVYPGLIAPSTTIGLVEINAVRATKDYRETGLFNPNVIAAKAYNPDSELIPVTRSNGILIVHTIPKGGRVSGSSSIMMLDGWTSEEATLKSPAGIHINWPQINIPKEDKESSKRDKNIKENEESSKINKEIKQLEEFFKKAKSYYDTEKLNQNIEIDLKLESMIPVFDKNIPLFIHTNRYEQIRSSIYFTKLFDVKMVLVGGADSYLLTDLLIENNIPVIYEHPLSTPMRRNDPYDLKYKIPKLLYDAGVQFCISGSSSNFESPHQRSLPYEAGMAVAFGLPYKEGLKSLTLNSAKILGIDNQVGSLEVGKDATLIITSGDPFLFETQVLQAFIQGRDVDLNDRHKMLRDKYDQKY